MVLLAAFRFRWVKETPWKSVHCALLGLCVGDASLTGSPPLEMPNVAGPVHIQNPRATPGTWTYFSQSSFTATACDLVSPGVLTGPDCGALVWLTA